MFCVKKTNRVHKTCLDFTVFTALLLCVSGAWAQPGGVVQPPGGVIQTYRMQTVVKDAVTTEWTLECPDGSVLDMTTITLTDRGIQELSQCLGQIESQVGIHISSQTVVKDFVVESDEILSTVEMTEDQVNKIKTIIDTHQIPMHPFPSTRPRVESVLLDGVLDSFIIDLGRGCLLDLTSDLIGLQTLDQLIQMLQQFEMENGALVTGATTVKDSEVEKDRVVQITHLLPHQIEQIFQFLQSQGLAVLFDQKLAPISMKGVVEFDGQRLDFDVRGDALLQFMPPDPQTNALPLEIVDLQMVSVDPLGLSVSLTPAQQPMPLFLFPSDPTGKLMALEGQLPNLVFDQVGSEQVTLIAHPGFAQEFSLFGCGPWPFMQPLCIYSLGLKPLAVPELPLPPDQPIAGRLMLQAMVLDLPLRIPVVPGG